MANAEPRSRTGRKNVRLYSVTQVAEILDCSDMHVYRQIAAGELRAVDIGSSGSGRPKSRIRSDDLADYIDRKTRAAAGTA
jgi:excisionase family DNA binding protein